MTISPVTSSVLAAALTTTYTLNTTHKAGETAATAVNIGDLEQQGTIIDVSDQGTTSGVQSYNFTLQQGDSAYLGALFSNPVDQLTTQIQLYDSKNNLIADNFGTTAQQAVYKQLTTTGLAPGAGNYNVKVTPVGGAGAPAISINALQQQGTSLAVNSQLTPNESAEYYNFSVSNSGNLKLAFDAGSDNSAARVQVYDSTGHLIADNRGTAYQQNAYGQLTSATGLAESSGNYSIKVSYADNAANTDQSLKYNFQLYSGTNYGVVYQTNAATAPVDNSAAGSVTAAPDTQAFGQQAYHSVNETAQTAVPVGWIQQNKTAINTTSLLTPVDSTDYYSFILQSGNNLKLSLTNLTDQTNTSAVRLQLLDGSGGRVIADNQGTAAQQAAFAELTSSTGLAATPASYVVKATYGQGASKDTNLEYNFQVFSGTTYSSVYNTTASAQNYENAVLSGDLGGGYNPSVAAASYLVNQANGTTTDIFGNPSIFA